MFYLIYILEPYVETSSSYSNVVFHSKSSEQSRSNIDVPEPSSNGRRSSMDFNATLNDDFGDENDNLGFINEEIAPGIIMEGDATDL